MNITGLKNGQQSLILQYQATIESAQDTIETLEKDENPDTAKIHEYKALISNTEEALRGVVKRLMAKSDTDTVDKWIDGIMNVIKGIEGYIERLPDDIEFTVRAVINQVKKALELIKKVF